MSLIEQLGGYEKAKSMCDHINGPLGLITDGYSHYTKAMVVDALFEHRRANNIFEVGDLVVLPYTNYRGDVFELTEGYREVYDEKGICYRHATPQEIEAGHRL